MIAFSLPVLIKGLEEDSEVRYFDSSKLLGQDISALVNCSGKSSDCLDRLLDTGDLARGPLALSLWLEGHAWVVSRDERLVALRFWERPGTLPGES